VQRKDNSLLKTLSCKCPRSTKSKQYLKLLLQNHKAIRKDKFDLGQTETLMHEIALKTAEPIYVKQFKILDVHRKEVEQHMLDWLKLGVI
jgi:hypothetical protein